MLRGSSILSIAALALTLMSCELDVEQNSRTVSIQPTVTGPKLMHYTFDESTGAVALDSSGNGLHGDIYSASRLPGNVGGALSFQSTTARVQIGLPWNAFGDIGAISVDAWVYPTSVAGTHLIIGNGPNGLEGFHFLINGGQLEFRLDSTSGWLTLVTSATPIATSVWTHVAATYDGATARLYVNGTEDASATITHAIGKIDWYLRIGAEGQYSSFTNQFEGTLDEVRVYNVQLTGTEILDYYNATKP